MKILIICF